MSHPARAPLSPPTYHEALLVVGLVCVSMVGAFVAVIWQMLT
jgi:hypothetical protein